MIKLKSFFSIDYKRSYLLLIIAAILISLAVVFLFKTLQINSANQSIEIVQNRGNEVVHLGDWLEIGEPIDVSELSQYDLHRLKTKDYGVYHVYQGIGREVVFDGHKISLIQISPLQEKLGFFYYPSGHSLQDIALVVLDTKEKTLKEVYWGGIRTSSFKWQDEETLIVNYSCGTECMLSYVIDANSGEKVNQYRAY